MSGKKMVRVCLRAAPKPADQCTQVELELGAIPGWGDKFVAALAAGVEIDPTTVASVWLREDDDDEEEPDRIDDKPKRGWKKVMNMDPDEAVLLLGTIATDPPAAAPATSTARPALPEAMLSPPPPPQRGLDEATEFAPEDQQNHERLSRLLLKEPHPVTSAFQEVRPRAAPPCTASVCVHIVIWLLSALL